MTAREANLFFEFLMNEEARLKNQFTQKWNFCYVNQTFDTLDLLDFIELTVQRDYLDFFWNKFTEILKICQPFT